jgi:hypothetical protein
MPPRSARWRQYGAPAPFSVHIADLSSGGYLMRANDFSGLGPRETHPDHRFTACTALTTSKGNVTRMSFPDEVYERPWTATTTGISFRTWNWETKHVARRKARFARIDGSRGSAPNSRRSAICTPGTSVARPQFRRGNCNDLSSSQARRIPGSLRLSVP